MGRIGVGGDGLPQQLQPADTTGINAFFTGTAALPALTLLITTGTSTLTVAPAVAGDSLAAGEVITVVPTTPLPAGMNISYALVTAANTVQIGFTATLAIALSSVTWRVCAHR
jgi:hypothetical protein